MQNLKYAKVYWRDASHYSRQNDIAWLKKEACLMDMVTVGQIIKVNRKIVVIAHEINSENDARDTSVIPRSSVSKIEYLEVRKS